MDSRRTLADALAATATAWATWHVARLPAGRTASGMPAEALAAGAPMPPSMGETYGAAVYLLVAVPLLVAALPLALARTPYRFEAELTSGMLLVVIVVFASPAVGLAYTPAALLGVAAALLGWRRDHPTSVGSASR